MDVRRRGFTLFEIMAAVLVMGVIFTVLAEVNIQGVLAEGTSRRRLEASLLADEVLSDLEGELLAGVFPEVGTREETLEDFVVVVDVQPFDPSPYLALWEAPEAGRASQREPAEDRPPGLLEPPTSNETSLIRSLEVTVSWEEGFDEYRVHRRTFAYDVETIASYVGAAEAGGATGDGEDGGDVGDDGGADGAGTPGRGATGGSGSKDDIVEQMRRILEEAR